jgi:hypothetical protein
MDLNLPVFATGVRIFRASNDVGPLFLDPGSTRILERNKHVDPGSRNRGPTSLLALKIRWLVSVVNDVEKKLVEFLMQKFKLVIKNIKKI